MKVDKEKLMRKLGERWKKVNCPYCGDHKWTVDPTIMTTIEVRENTAFVNALVLDCIKDNEGSKEG